MEPASWVASSSKFGLISLEAGWLLCNGLQNRMCDIRTQLHGFEVKCL